MKLHRYKEEEIDINLSVLVGARKIKPGEVALAAERAKGFIEEIINKAFGLPDPETISWESRSYYIRYLCCDTNIMTQKLYFEAHKSLNLKKLSSEKIKSLIDELGCQNIKISIYDVRPFLEDIANGKKHD